MRIRVQKLLAGLLGVGVVFALAACGEEPVVTLGVDDVDDMRISGTLSVQEGNYLGNQSAKLNVNFKLEQPVCGVQVAYDDGDCSITTKAQVTCAPGCTAGQLCTWEADCSAGKCVDVAAMHAGDIMVTGAAHQDPLTCSYNAALQPPKYECDLNAQQDVFDPGDALRIEAAGDIFPAFAHTVSTPPDHSFTTNTGQWTTDTFDGSADVPLQWDATQTADEFKLTVISDSGKRLVCRFADTGSFTLPREGIAALGSDVIQVDIHRQNVFVADEGGHELTIMTVEGLATPIAGSCYSCSRYLQACQTACPDLDNVCEDASRDAATALNDCVCAECATECELTCSGSGSDASCKPCKQGAMNGACSADRSTCQSN